MKRIIGIILAFSSIFLFPDAKGQSTGTRETGEFTSLNVSGKIRVEIYPAENTSFDLDVKGTSTDNVITENKSGEFGIRLKTSTPSDAEIRVKLYYTRLEKITSQAQALVLSPDTLHADKMIFDSRVGGKMELMLQLNSLEADVKQGGILVFYGEVDKQTVKVSSGGTYSAFELEANDTYVTAQAGGKAKVVANEKLEANASAKGYIGYKGEPAKIAVKTNLGGEIVHIKGEDQD